MSAEYTHQPEIAAIIGDPAPFIDVYSRQLEADTRFISTTNSLSLASQQLSADALRELIENTTGKLASDEDAPTEEQQLAAATQAITRASIAHRAAADQLSAAYKDGNSMEQRIGEALNEIPAAHYVTRAIGALCDPLGRRWGRNRNPAIAIRPNLLGHHTRQSR